jgi:hypothetical protein
MNKWKVSINGLHTEGYGFQSFCDALEKINALKLGADSKNHTRAEVALTITLNNQVCSYIDGKVLRKNDIRAMFNHEIDELKQVPIEFAQVRMTEIFLKMRTCHESHFEIPFSEHFDCM